MAKSPTSARGMPDHLPDDTRRRARLLRELRDVYDGLGFDFIETPAVENLDVIQSGQGGDNEKLIFKVMKRDADLAAASSPDDLADLGLRFDLTLPLARFYANHRARVGSPFRVAHFGNVWRAERPQKGRFRQFLQCDIDILGEPGVLAEVDLLVSGVRALAALGVSPFTVRLNDRRLLTGLLAEASVPEEHHGRALILLDKVEALGGAEVAELLRRDVTSSDGLIELLPALESAQTLDDLPIDVDPHVRADHEAILAAVRPAARDVGGDIAFDALLIRGMGYYTGPVFEVRSPELSSSIAGGGRYDGLIGRFAGESVPACGFSLGFDRLLDLTRDLGETAPSVVLLHDRTAAPADVLAAMDQLRAQGYRASRQHRAKNIKHQLSELAKAGERSYVLLEAELGAVRDL